MRISVTGGGGGQTPVCSQLGFKRKRCRMLWNEKICILMTNFAKYIHLRLFEDLCEFKSSTEEPTLGLLEGFFIFFYQIVHFRPFWIYGISNNGKKRVFYFRFPQKNGFCRTGGVRKLRTCPQLLGFFTPSLATYGKVFSINLSISDVCNHLSSIQCIYIIHIHIHIHWNR